MFSIFNRTKKYHQEWADEASWKSQVQMTSTDAADSFERVYDKSTLSDYNKVFVARPKAVTGPLPIIFDIHGGSFSKGSKEVDRPLALHLASYGFAVVGIDFPQAFESDYVGMLKHIISAMRYVFDKAEALMLDSSQCFLLGHSSGAQLAYALTVLTRSESLRQMFKLHTDGLNFKSVVLDSPVCYLKQLNHLKGYSVLMKDLFGKDKEALRFFSSPEELYSKIEGHLPPIRIITSLGDTRFHQQALQLINYLSNQHETLETAISTDHSLGHCFILKDEKSIEALTTIENLAMYFRKFIVDNSGR